MPPELENKLTNWPNWAVKMRTSSSQAEGAIREFAAGTMKIIGNAKGQVTGVECARVDRNRQPIPGTEFVIKADLVLLAIGFASPVHEGMLTELGAQFDRRGNLFADTLSYAPASRGSLPPATCAAGSRSWSGPSAKAARPPAPSMSP